VRQQNESPLPPSTYNADVPETLGGAVLRALEGDPSRRYASADELAGGLRLGLEGEDVTVPEGATPTRVLGGDTAATRHLDRTTAQTEYRPAQSQTRRPQPRAPQPPPVAPPPPPARTGPPRQKGRSGFSRFVRFVLALVALALVAAAVASAVIYATDQAAGVKVKQVAGDTVDKVVEELKEAVQKNTE